MYVRKEYERDEEIRTFVFLHYAYKTLLIRPVRVPKLCRIYLKIDLSNVLIQLGFTAKKGLFNKSRLDKSSLTLLMRLDCRL